MIGVGINQNVVINKATVNDKKTLSLELIEKEKLGGQKKSVFDSLLAAGIQDEGSGAFTLYLFSPKVPNKENQTTEDKIQLITGDLTKLRNQLTQILEQYMTADKIDLNSMEVQFASTGITDGVTYEARILDQDVLTRIYDNMVGRFIQLITPFVGNPTYALRFKLIRQSKDKHYATIPSKFIKDNPFVDLMEVPEDQTKVKFSKWELDNGLNDGTPVARDTAETKAENAEAAAPAANPFASK